MVLRGEGANNSRIGEGQSILVIRPGNNSRHVPCRPKGVTRWVMASNRTQDLRTNLHRKRGTSRVGMATNWKLWGKPFWTCCTPLRMKSNQTADKRWRQPKGFHDSFRQPKIVAKLGTEVRLYREKSERAEGWLSKISTEIEDRLVNEPKKSSGFIDLSQVRTFRTVGSTRLTKLTSY
jgi:hypothetical protein